MAEKTHIEWTDATWNPITGCSVVSPGCANCYAMRLAGTRLADHPSRVGLTNPSKAGPVWNGNVRLNDQWIDQPLRWKKPRRIFVCAHGDLFHEAVPDEWIDRIFAVMALAPQHIFLVLTKRPERMREYIANAAGRVADAVQPLRTDRRAVGPLPHIDPGQRWWPLPNCWPGVSVEDQPTADERIPLLLDTPAAVRWISAEPLLGPIKIRGIIEGCGDCDRCLAGRSDLCHAAFHVGALTPDGGGIAWVVAGGESGPGARPMRPEWVRDLRDQCAEAGVPFFFKQWGSWATGEAGEMRLVGKKRAGAILDGREHRAWPELGGVLV